MKYQVDRVRKLLRRRDSLDSKIEDLATREPRVQRVLVMQYLLRQTREALDTELKMLGHLAAEEKP